MNRLNNKGLTLVEIIISLLILGIISTMFASCFATAARILNRATTYKNAVSAASSSVEVQETISSTDDRVVIETNADEITLNDEGSEIITMNCEKWSRTNENADFKKASSFNIQDVKGVYLVAEETKSTELTFKEFLPNNVGSKVAIDVTN